MKKRAVCSAGMTPELSSAVRPMRAASSGLIVMTRSA
jgi:hypothetical protein